MNQSEIDFFDALAPSWDENEIRSTPERVKHILSELPISKGMDVLDLGTGTGVLLPYLNEIVGPEGHVTAIDQSEGMLSIARKKYGHLDNVEFLKLDFEEELIPGKYDVALLYSVYPHLHAPADTIEWLFKMNMKPDGIIVIAFPSDEEFINNIHHEKKAEHDHLPPANVLAEMIRYWGYKAEVLAATPDEYIIEIKNL
ncbi:MAG: class I SAM-dependent methyltransferase [Muribaculaceae bacterium]|nr:class I SAM-dependent methyltransferase [Muribaculaceae bacterium]MDE7095932.1 class I SAM-dependent methyltransferase [Muribaculaceae bacterium]